MAELRLPIGIQHFDKLREGKWLYVDKTEHVYNIVSGSGQYFLSRPRRFGKSLFLSTIKCLFQGKKQLFNGLYIEDKWDWSEKNPVIHISFAAIGYRSVGLENALHQALNEIAKEYEIDLVKAGFDQRFSELIVRLSQQNKVVILIDEYDKPIIDYLDEESIHIAKQNRDTLKTFYSVLKDLGDHIRLLFITGVSKFAKVSIFSDLNHLEDLTVHSRYGTICGYTQVELEESFAPKLAEMPPDTLNELKKWYNGYSWDAKTAVYNPFSVLRFFSAEQFDNYWFETGTPTFLVQLLNKDFQYDFENIEADPNIFNSYTLENLDRIPLLFQTGYLTIKSRTKYGTIILSYPNKEVKDAMMKYLLGDYLHISPGITAPTVLDILRGLEKNDIPWTIKALQALFKSIPSNIFIAKAEKYYHSIVHLTFKILGIYTESEVHTSDGRLDAVVITDSNIYIFEFKLDQSADIALSQIIEKNYAAPYKASRKPLTAIGVSFSSKTKGIVDFKSTVL